MEKRNNIYVTKASGDTVPFSPTKLRRSMEKAGATEEQVEDVIEKVSSRLRPGIPTRSIYSMAFKFLKESSGPAAAKFHLKKAIMELGPSGFPFEKYISEILHYQGYKVKVGEIVQGQCVKHEIDVIAEKDDQYFMIECKYHNQSGTVCDVKIPLYIHSRFKDVESTWIKTNGHQNKFYQGWVVTNTRFTDDAVQYGNCAGLKLLGWSYPNGNSLRDQIDALGLYPITCLTTLTKIEKQRLLDKRIVLCKEICIDSNLLKNLGIKQSRINGIVAEAIQLCQHLVDTNKYKEDI